MSQQSTSPRTNISLVGLLFAVLFPPLGLIISILAWRAANNSGWPKAVAVVGTVIGAVLSVIMLFFTGLFIALGVFTTNKAKIELKPITTQIMALGGEELCDNGNSGHGIDNQTPWYEVYFKVRSGVDIEDKLRRIAREAGYRLNTATPPPHVEEFNSESDYLIGQKGHKVLTVIVSQKGSVSLNCSKGVYGREKSVGDGTILDLALTIDKRN